MDASIIILYTRTLLLLILTTAVVCDIPDVSTEDTEENLLKLAAANNNFAFNLHRRMVAGDPKQNVFFSPFSISMAFAMLFCGAKGDTAKEIRNTFGYDAAGISDEAVHATFKYLLRNILLKNDSNIKNANAILVDQSIEVNSNYSDRVQDVYQANIMNVDFASNAAKLKDEINDWVRDKTMGKIDSILDRVPSSAIAVILNAVYFKGIWKTPFEAEFTSRELFYNDGQDSQAREVDMMYVEGRFPLTSELDATIVELPYASNHISMLILLPNEQDGLLALENSLNFESLVAIRMKLRLTKKAFRLRIPKFKIEYSKSLVEDLMALNTRSVFSPEADFSGMVKEGGLAISDVLHKAAIETNEEGSTAAAATAGVVSRRGYTLVADHPFLFAIVNRRTDLMLFLGRVNNL